MSKQQDYVLDLETLDSGDGDRVGGKNASLGEMLQRLADSGIRVPPGFATTAQAYRAFLEANGLEARIRDILGKRDQGKLSLAKAGEQVRQAFYEARFPDAVREAIIEGYRDLARRMEARHPPVAVRSSATAEDLPEASFAGQQESFLNVRGEEALLEACRRCYASLFTDRAISYRENHGFDHLRVALSVGVQRMVRGDTGGAGVMFSIDTESGFPDAVLITAAWGLGESVVQGTVEPDEYLVFKPLLERPDLTPILAKTRGGKATKMIYADDKDNPVRRVDTSARERNALVLSDDEVLQLARWAAVIETHYDKPMDMEWARDGAGGDLYIVQARPETVQSQKAAQALNTYTLNQSGTPLVRGHAIGQAIAAGKVIRLDTPDQMETFEAGAVLVTEMTDPDWVPIMKRAAAIVTDQGGRTSHAAIVSRELGLPAVVGCQDATRALKDGRMVTVSCAQGEEGIVYDGELDFQAKALDLDDIPDTRTRIMLNLANPSAALRWWRLPADGVGLARMEFIVNNAIKIHPMALLGYDDLKDKEAKKRIDELSRGYDDKPQYFVETLARGIAMIAASQYPRPVILRLSDFKTNEYAQLIGGGAFEPREENPMLGWRGASRYYHPDYRPGFDLECRAVVMAREVIGLDNLVVMVPFCRTLTEADRVLGVMAENGLTRGEKGLEIYVMAELPSNVILAQQYARRFDGFSIGSNDLTQLVLGVDRDSERLAELFDEGNEAVTEMIALLIERAHKAGRKVGLCGQAPSDQPDFARFLVEAGIDSISVNPDSFLQVKQQVAAAERLNEE